MANQKIFVLFFFGIIIIALLITNVHSGREKDDTSWGLRNRKHKQSNPSSTRAENVHSGSKKDDSKSSTSSRHHKSKHNNPDSTRAGDVHSGNKKQDSTSSTSSTSLRNRNHKHNNPDSTRAEDVHSGSKKHGSTSSSSSRHRKLKDKIPEPTRAESKTPSQTHTSSKKKPNGSSSIKKKDTTASYPPDWYDDSSGSTFCGCCRKSDGTGKSTTYTYPNPYLPASPNSYIPASPTAYLPPPSDQPVTPSGTGNSAAADVVGFAKVGGVTGGWAGQVVQINTLDQLIQYVGDSVPRVLMITSDIKASDLATVQLGSAKSIVSQNGAKLYNIYFRATSSSQNIIFQNLIFEHSASIKSNDAIQLHLDFGNAYWIDHCSFPGHDFSPDDGSRDKLLYIGEQATDATISNCYFGNHKYGPIFGHPSDDPSESSNGNTRVTIYNNRYENVYVRAPGLFRNGLYHVFNNVINNYGLGFTVATNGAVFSEYNYFGTSSNKNGMLDDKGTGSFSDTGSVPAITNQKSPLSNWNPLSYYTYQLQQRAIPGMMKAQRPRTSPFHAPRTMVVPPPGQHMVHGPSFRGLP